MQALNMTQSRVSRNLGILKDAGLVKDRRDGLWVHYSLNEDSFNIYAESLLKLLEEWADDDRTVINDLKSLNKAVKLSQSERQVS